MAEHAARQLHNNLRIKNQRISVNWANPRSKAVADEVRDSGAASDQPLVMPAPAGLENAPTSAYALNGMNLPVLPAANQMAGFNPPPPSQPLPQDNIGAKRKLDDGESIRPPLPPSKLSYPSMNPSRLGAS
jgi:hypothetical protein